MTPTMHTWLLFLLNSAATYLALTSGYWLAKREGSFAFYTLTASLILTITAWNI
jgi:hypothetical protein